MSVLSERLQRQRASLVPKPASPQAPKPKCIIAMPASKIPASNTDARGESTVCLIIFATNADACSTAPSVLSFTGRTALANYQPSSILSPRGLSVLPVKNVHTVNDCYPPSKPFRSICAANNIVPPVIRKSSWLSTSVLFKSIPPWTHLAPGSRFTAGIPSTMAVQILCWCFLTLKPCRRTRVTYLTCWYVYVTTARCFSLGVVKIVCVTFFSN